MRVELPQEDIGQRATHRAAVVISTLACVITWCSPLEVVCVDSVRSAHAIEKDHATGKDVVPWSSVISFETVRGELKSNLEGLNADLRSAEHFRRVGHRHARKRFATTAALFAVVAAYDKPTPWRHVSGRLRDFFCDVGEECAAGTRLAYQRAHEAQRRLAEMVNEGATMLAEKSPSADWSKLVQRAALMSRLESAHQVLDSHFKAGFETREARDAMSRQLEVIQMIAHVLIQPHAPDADDANFRKHALTLAEHASKTKLAVKASDSAAAWRSYGNVTKSCSQCHAEWR